MVECVVACNGFSRCYRSSQIKLLSLHSSTRRNGVETIWSNKDKGAGDESHPLFRASWLHLHEKPGDVKLSSQLRR